jgi:hypothetical protein
VGDPGESPSARPERADEARGLRLGMAQRLTERERGVLELRFGLRDGEPLTLKEVGWRLGCTREWVRARSRPVTSPGSISVILSLDNPSPIGVAHEAGHAGGWVGEVDLGPPEAVWRLMVGGQEFDGRPGGAGAGRRRSGRSRRSGPWPGW